MSHISKIELEVKDIQVLISACKRLGLELLKGQKTFKWYGKEAGCDHAVRVPGADYEIGVVKDEAAGGTESDVFGKVEIPGEEKGGITLFSKIKGFPPRFPLLDIHYSLFDLRVKTKCA